MKERKRVFLGSLLVLGSLVLVLTLCASQASAETKTLKIGLITSVTGPMAPAFKPMYDAVKPTEELINARGGVTVAGQKYDIKILAEDDQSSPPGAIAAANRLVQQGVKFLIPPMFMVTDLALIPTAEEAKVVRMKAFGLGPEEIKRIASIFTPTSSIPQKKINPITVKMPSTIKMAAKLQMTCAKKPPLNIY